MPDKTNAARQSKFRERQRAMGRRRLQFWVTDAERRELTERLKHIRRAKQH